MTDSMDEQMGPMDMEFHTGDIVVRIGELKRYIVSTIGDEFNPAVGHRKWTAVLVEMDSPYSEYNVDCAFLDKFCVKVGSVYDDKTAETDM